MEDLELEEQNLFLADSTLQPSTNPQEMHEESIKRQIESLVHACRCRQNKCQKVGRSCQKMKRVVTHTKICKRKTKSECPICKQLIALCYYHATHCQESGDECVVPFCSSIKSNLREKQRSKLTPQAPLIAEPGTSEPSQNEILQVLDVLPPHLIEAFNQLQMDGSLQQIAGGLAPAGTETAAGLNIDRPEEWRLSITAEHRDQHVQKLVQALCATSDATAMLDMYNDVAYARKVEGDMFETAGARSEYYHLLAEKIDNINRGQDEKRWMQQQDQAGVVTCEQQAPAPQQQQTQPQMHQQALRQLMATLRSPTSHNQQQEILQILKSNPPLMAAFIKHRLESSRAGSSGGAGQHMDQQ